MRAAAGACALAWPRSGAARSWAGGCHRGRADVAGCGRSVPREAWLPWPVSPSPAMGP